jgi:hypothetical protein
LLEQESHALAGREKSEQKRNVLEQPGLEAEAVYDEVGELIPELCL